MAVDVLFLNGGMTMSNGKQPHDFHNIVKDIIERIKILTNAHKEYNTKWLKKRAEGIFESHFVKMDMLTCAQAQVLIDLLLAHVDKLPPKDQERVMIFIQKMPMDLISLEAHDKLR